jgi:hypothetical protein
MLGRAAAQLSLKNGMCTKSGASHITSTNMTLGRSHSKGEIPFKLTPNTLFFSLVTYLLY